MITIDGPAGAGKSTVARELARRLGYRYVNSGAVYRAVAWLLIRKFTTWDTIQEHVLQQILHGRTLDLSTDREGNTRVVIDNKDITEQLRSAEVDRVVPLIAQRKIVRQFVRKRLRSIAKAGDIVLEGRDMGTVVFPQAQVKFFLDADPLTRARRRYSEMIQAGLMKNLEDCVRDLQHRDALDSSRDLAPLQPAEDAVHLDTTNLSVDQVVDMMVRHLDAACLSTEN